MDRVDEILKEIDALREAAGPRTVIFWTEEEAKVFAEQCAENEIEEPEIAVWSVDE